MAYSCKAIIEKSITCFSPPEWSWLIRACLIKALTYPKLSLMITQAGTFGYTYIFLQLMMSNCQYQLHHEALWFSCINIPHNVLLQDDRHCWAGGKKLFFCTMSLDNLTAKSAQASVSDWIRAHKRRLYSIRIDSYIPVRYWSLLTVAGGFIFPSSSPLNESFSPNVPSKSPRIPSKLPPLIFLATVIPADSRIETTAGRHEPEGMDDPVEVSIK